MIELTYVGDAQEVLQNAPIVYNTEAVHSGCCERYREGSGQVKLVKAGRYLVSFSGNVAIPTGGTVGEVTLGIAQDGEILTGSVMRATPAAANLYMNVSTQHYVDVYCNCCTTVSVRAINAAIEVLDANFSVVRVA